MTVILAAKFGTEMQINLWHWRPTVSLLRRVLDLDDQRVELLQVNGCGAEISASEASKIADYLDGYLREFPQNGRLLLDGSISCQPKGSLDLDEGDWDRHYSASYDWLADFRDFCRGSGGFEII